MQSLQEVRGALIRALGDEGKLPMLNARLILRTGVSLTDISTVQDHDQRHVDSVVVALRDMGFELTARKEQG